ncbi:MAG: methyltransferase [Aliidongia sp.]
MTIDALTPGSLIDLATARWKSQIMHAGVALGVFEHLSESTARSSVDLSNELGTDAAVLYRLLRALASMGLLAEGPDRTFKTQAGTDVLRGDHPQSMKGLVLLEAGDAHYAVWRYLPEIIKTGIPDGFPREFGVTLFDYFRQNATYAGIFQQAMSSFSAAEGHAICQALAGRLPDGGLLCDIGGGHGSLLSGLLRDRPNASGIVFDLPEVTAEAAKHIPPDLAGRMVYTGGDMFKAVPPADTYFMKHIVHDWNDDECVTILKAVRQAARPGTRFFICELIVPGPAEPHFAKLFDIHMLCISTGSQRTATELQALLDASGWRGVGVHALDHSPMSVLEAVAV